VDDAVNELIESMTLDDMRSLLENWTGKKNYQKKSYLSFELKTFYNNPKNFSDIYEKLTEYERKVVDLYVQTNGRAPSYKYDRLMKQYGKNQLLRYSYYSSYYGISYYFDEKSKARMLFVKKKMPDFVFDTLKKIVPAIEYKVFSDKDIPVNGLLISRPDRISDFALLTRFCSSNSVSATALGTVSKKHALKFLQISGYDEICAYGVIPPEIKNTGEMRITSSLFLLAQTAGLIIPYEKKLIVPNEAGDFFKKSKIDQVDYLLNKYINSKEVEEINFIKGIRLTGKINWTSFRKELILCLSDFFQKSCCETSDFILFSDFRDYMEYSGKMLDGLEYLLEPTMSSWEYTCEKGGKAVLKFILSMLNAIGIVDLVWDTKPDEASLYPFDIHLIRINQLGAFILGLTDRQPEFYNNPQQNLENGFIVQPNFDIFVPESENRMTYEIFFDRFLMRVSTEDETTIYNIDFASIVRALDCGITIKEITDYLSAGSAKPIPDNVARALLDWEDKSKRIFIRTVTIVETADSYLLEEIKHIKGMGSYIKKEIPYSIEIEKENIKKIKKMIENQKHFCLYEI